MPLVLAVVAVTGVVLGALYMLRFALGFLYGAAQGAAPAARRSRRCARSAILAPIVAAVFALGLFPHEPMKKTELAAEGVPRSSSRRRALTARAAMNTARTS